MATTKKKLTHEDYVVGWICPMRVEYTAALLMLDEEHEILGQDVADENIYTLGSINGHNVVLATLPKTGNSPTARVMTNMSRTFQALRFYLLVGIGGGMPMRTDDGPVRLGDVVVSEGVKRHDRGKFEASGFKLKGTLAPPPQVLLAATNTLLAKRDMTDDDPLLEHLSRIDTSKRRIKRYQFPGRKRDQSLLSRGQSLSSSTKRNVLERNPSSNATMVIVQTQRSYSQRWQGNWRVTYRVSWGNCWESWRPSRMSQTNLSGSNLRK